MLKECSLLIVWWTLLTSAMTATLHPLPSSVTSGDCRSSEDCGPSSCCLLGMMRYSTPWCAPLLKLGDECRPSSGQLINRTLSYPGGLEIFLKDAHQVLCPCDVNQGLVCSRLKGTCVYDVANDITPF